MELPLLPTAWDEDDGRAKVEYETRLDIKECGISTNRPHGRKEDMRREGDG